MKNNLLLSILTVTLFPLAGHSTPAWEKRSAEYAYAKNPVCNIIGTKVPMTHPKAYPAAWVPNPKKPCLWYDPSEPVPERRGRTAVTEYLYKKIVGAFDTEEIEIE